MNTHGRTVVLRELADADRSPLAAMLADRSLQHLLMAYPPGDGVADVDSWMDRRRNDPGTLFRVVTDDTDAFLGFVQITSIHFRGRFGWLGMAMAAAARGRGAGRAALQALMVESQSVLGLGKILLEVRADNEPAIALYRGLGYRDVGTFLSHYDNGLRRYDVLVMERSLEGLPEERTVR
jgi:RimJ/RimL family protein N-acetyltransferase